MVELKFFETSERGFLRRPMINAVEVRAKKYAQLARARDRVDLGNEILKLKIPSNSDACVSVVWSCQRGLKVVLRFFNSSSSNKQKVKNFIFGTCKKYFFNFPLPSPFGY